MLVTLQLDSVIAAFTNQILCPRGLLSTISYQLWFMHHDHHGDHLAKHTVSHQALLYILCQFEQVCTVYFK